MSNKHLQSPTQPSLANIKANNFRNIYLGKNKGISGGDLLLIWQGKCLFNSFLSHLFKEKKNPIPSTTRKCYPRQYTTTYRFSYFDYASQYTLLVLFLCARYSYRGGYSSIFKSSNAGKSFPENQSMRKSLQNSLLIVSKRETTRLILWL